MIGLKEVKVNPLQ